MTKSEAAFRFTVDKLFDSGCLVYFWTFTFVFVYEDSVAFARFRRFLWDLQRQCAGRFGGVRVAEMHREHGVHFHALVNRRVPVDLVRGVGRKHGIGRVFVERANRAAGPYLAKYLSKQREGPRAESGRSLRRWAAFGDAPRTKVCEVVNESDYWVFRRANRFVWLGFRNESRLRMAWLYGEAIFRACWFAARAGRWSDVFGLSCGVLGSHGPGDVHGRLTPALSVSPF